MDSNSVENIKENNSKFENFQNFEKKKDPNFSETMSGEVYI
jgi:hypothetical protein